MSAKIKMMFFSCKCKVNDPTNVQISGRTGFGVASLNLCKYLNIVLDKMSLSLWKI
jgi:hypothetical protein